MKPECFRNGCPMAHREFSGRIACDLHTRFVIIGIPNPSNQEIIHYIIMIANGKRLSPRIPYNCVGQYATNLPREMIYISA